MDYLSVCPEGSMKHAAMLHTDSSPYISCPAALIGQFVSDVAWGELDVLLVDTPPGTSDEHLAILENLKKHKVDGAVLVTTPQVHTFIDCSY